MVFGARMVSSARLRGLPDPALGDPLPLFSRPGFSRPPSFSHPFSVNPESGAERAFLERHQAPNTDFGEIHQNIHLFATEWISLGRSLDFDNPTPPGHDNIHVGIALGIFGIVEIKDRRTGKNPNRDRRHM